MLKYSLQCPSVDRVQPKEIQPSKLCTCPVTDVPMPVCCAVVLRICSLILLAGCNWWRVLSSTEQATTLRLEREVQGKGGKPSEVLELVLKVQPHNRKDGPQQVSCNWIGDGLGTAGRQGGGGG